MVKGTHPRRLILGAVFSFVVLMVAGVCGGGEQSTLERVREQGFVRIGFANEAPYGFAKNRGR